MDDSTSTKTEKPAHLRALYDEMTDREFESDLRRQRIETLIEHSGCGVEYRREDLHVHTWSEPKDAIVAVEEWTRGLGDKPGLYLWGPVGTGKTHLAQSAIIDAVKRRVRRSKFISAPELIHHFRETNAEDSQMTENEAVRFWGEVPLLAIDDLGVDKATAYSVQVLYRLIDYRVSKEMPTLITSNYKLALLGERLAPIGDRDQIEATRILDRLNEHCVRIELSGRSHRV